MDVKEALEKFGLNHKEIKVYLSLLELGTATASDISKKTKILRQTVYDVILSLTQKGLIAYVAKSGKKYFEAARPDTFKYILKEKEIAIDEVLPKLESLQKMNKVKPKVEFYEGAEGLKTIYNDIIKNAKVLYEYGNAENFVKVLKLYFIENYIQRRVEAKIKLKLITEKEKATKDISKTNKKILRETRSLPIMKDIKTLNYIYANKFVIITLTENPIGVIIENTEISEAQKKIFETLWHTAQPY